MVLKCEGTCKDDVFFHVSQDVLIDNNLIFFGTSET